MNQVEDILSEMQAMSSEAAKEATHKFVPTTSNVIGLRMPQIDSLVKKYKSVGPELPSFLWESGYFDMRMMAVKLVPFFLSKGGLDGLQLMRKWAPEIDNWAICDTIAVPWSRILVKKNPVELLSLSSRFRESENEWEVRLGLAILIPFSKLFEYRSFCLEEAEKYTSDSRYYIKKAAVWLKREASKQKKPTSSS